MPWLNLGRGVCCTPPVISCAPGFLFSFFFLSIHPTSPQWYLFYKHLLHTFVFSCPHVGNCRDTSLQFRHLSLSDVNVAVATLIS